MAAKAHAYEALAPSNPTINREKGRRKKNGAAFLKRMGLGLGAHKASGRQPAVGQSNESDKGEGTWEG